MGPPPMDHEGNGWSEYQMLVLAELKRHNEVLEALARDLSDLKIELALFDRHHERITRLETSQVIQDVELGRLETKASLWGGVGGALAGLLAALAAALLNRG